MGRYARRCRRTRGRDDRRLRGADRDRDHRQPRRLRALAGDQDPGDLRRRGGSALSLQRPGSDGRDARSRDARVDLSKTEEDATMRHRRLAAIAIAVAATMTLVMVATTNAARTAAATGKPIVIGAAIDLTKNMAPFDAPALEAAQIEIKKINAAGGVGGRPLEMKFINDQLDPTQTKADALKLVGQGVNIGWVTCDVNYATPAILEF